MKRSAGDFNHVERNLIATRFHLGNRCHRNFPIVEPKTPGDRVRILSVENLTPEEADKIRSSGRNIDLILLRDRSELKDNVAEAEVILGVVGRQTVLNARKPKWVQTWAARVESLPEQLMEHPCVLTNMQQVFAPVIAESALGLMLSLTRGLAQISIPAFRERRWTTTDVPLADPDFGAKDYRQTLYKQFLAQRLE